MWGKLGRCGAWGIPGKFVHGEDGTGIVLERRRMEDCKEPNSTRKKKQVFEKKSWGQLGRCETCGIPRRLNFVHGDNCTGKAVDMIERIEETVKGLVAYEGRMMLEEDVMRKF